MEATQRHLTPPSPHPPIYAHTQSGSTITQFTPTHTPTQTHDLFYHPDQTSVRILARCVPTYMCTQSYIMQMDPREISGHDALTYMCTHLYVMEMDPNRISVYSALTYMCTHLYVMQLDPSKYNYMSSRWIPVPVHLCQRTEQSVSYSRYGSVPAAVSGLCHLCHLVLSVVCRN